MKEFTDYNSLTGSQMKKWFSILQKALLKFTVGNKLFSFGYLLSMRKIPEYLYICTLLCEHIGLSDWAFVCYMYQNKAFSI